MQRPRREGFDSAPRTRSQSRPNVVDVIVLTSDPALLATLQEAAGVGHQFFYAESIGSAVELLLGGRCGILVIDVAIVGKELARLTEKLQSQFPEVILLATGQRNEQRAVGSLVANGRIYRFLHKPVSPARAELFLSAATRRHGELHQADSRGESTVHRLAALPNLRILVAIVAGLAVLTATWLLWPKSAPTPEPQARAPQVTAPPAPVETTNAARIRETLALADDAYEAGNLLPPASGNAFDRYRATLTLDPNNADARAAIDQIVADIERKVMAAIDAKDAAAATVAFMNLQKIAPNHSRLEALQAQLIALARSARPTQVSVPTRQTAPRQEAPRPPGSTSTRVTSNLDLAKTFLAANQLVEPVDASALRHLRLARASGENESAVQIAATDLGSQLLRRAVTATNAGDLTAAKQAYDIAVSVDREFETSLPDIEAVGARVRELDATMQRTTVANERIAQVAKLRTSGRLVEPAGDNAYEALKQILAEGPTTPELRNEQQRLSFALLERTRTALAAGDIDSADVLATRAEDIQPGLPQTKALREQIGAARAERDERNAVLQAASLRRRREVPAMYPREAMLNGTQGWVDLEFVISGEGVPTDISVKAAQPSRVFDAAAIQALRQWRFEPIVSNGTQQGRRAALRMEFKLK